MWGAGSSLKVTILQSSNSRAFNTTPLTSGPRPGDSTSATPAIASTPSKQSLQFFCYICKASSSSQQVLRAEGEGWDLWLCLFYTAPWPFTCIGVFPDQLVEQVFRI